MDLVTLFAACALGPGIRGAACCPAHPPVMGQVRSIDADGLLAWAYLTAGGASHGALTLGDLPDHCQTLIEKLTQQKTGSTSNNADDDDAKNSRLIAALEQSAAAD